MLKEQSSSYDKQQLSLLKSSALLAAITVCLLRANRTFFILHDLRWKGMFNTGSKVHKKLIGQFNYPIVRKQYDKFGNFLSLMDIGLSCVTSTNVKRPFLFIEK